MIRDETTARTPTRAALMAVLIFLGTIAGAGAQEAQAPTGIRAQPLEPVGPGTGTLRATETGAQKEDLLAYADLLFSKEQYPLAARQYQLFLKQYPNSPNAQAGWFRLGECYLQAGQNEDAAATFNHVIQTWKQGIFVGSAAYRLAVLKFNAKDYPGAVSFFKTATANLQSADAALQAKFYLARCLQLADQPEQAVPIYQEVIDAKAPDPEQTDGWKNPFRERSLLELARLQYDVGKAKEAFARFEELAASAENPEYRLEALARSGLLAADLGDPEKSEDYLNRALKIETEGDNPWHALATVGLIFNYFTHGEYKKVIGLYSSQTFNAPEDSRPRMLLIVAHSYRLTDDLKNAAEIYELVERNYRNLPEGAEAGYRKLQVLLQTGDAGFPIYVANYVDQQTRIDPSSEFIDLSLLMRAEWHFSKAQQAEANGERKEAADHYADAAVDYAKVRGEKVPEKYLPQRLYKLGWAQSESGDRSGAIVTLGEFIRSFSAHELLPSALAKRAETYQALQDYSAALDDYRSIVDDHPDAREAEFSLLQIAHIHGDRHEVPEMMASYRELIQKFPKSPAVPEAHYWIGVGLFDQEKYEKAVSELDEARKTDPESYAVKASLRIILCHYQNENLDALAEEATAYLEAAKKEERAAIPPQVLGYLGRRLFDRQDYKRAELFLTASSTPDDPTATSSEIWDMLGRTRMKLGRHKAAIAPFENYLSMTQRPSLRAQTLLELGRAYLEIGDHEKALKSARESLSLLKEGRTNAETRLLVGDIATAQGDPATAAREYLVVSQIFVDPEITPLALTRAAKAFRQAGDEEKAAELEEMRKRDYPDYQP